MFEVRKEAEERGTSMNLFDILGPVMVGPSSSHTAGAVRIGLAARRLLGEGTPKSAMAAAALCYLGGGDAEAICHAAALAIKSLLGLVCDPIAGLVEVPCIKRNASGAMVAMCCADMALAGIRSAVPPDEVIMAMKDVGDKMDVSLRVTGLGGIAGTPSGVKIADELRLAYGHLNG